MVEFFIALFGGLYYGGRYLGEKTLEHKHDMAVATRQKLREHIINTYCVDRNENLNNRAYVNTNFDKICDEFKEELTYALGDDFKPEFSKPIPRECRGIDWSGDPRVWLYRLVLASRGKIDDDLAIWSSGYHLGSPEYRERNQRFAEMIEKRLIAAGVNDIKLVVVHEHYGYSVQIQSLCIGQYQRLW